jgi:hypothetical protein
MLIVLGAFLINRRFSSVMVLAPLPRLALMDQKITLAFVSFDSLSGITPVQASRLQPVPQYW